MTSILPKMNRNQSELSLLSNSAGEGNEITSLFSRYKKEDDSHSNGMVSLCRKALRRVAHHSNVFDEVETTESKHVLPFSNIKQDGIGK